MEKEHLNNDYIDSNCKHLLMLPSIARKSNNPNLKLVKNWFKKFQCQSQHLSQEIFTLEYFYTWLFTEHCFIKLGQKSDIACAHSEW